MRTGVHYNSITAYRSEAGRISKRAQRVKDWLQDNGPATDRQVAQGLGFSDMNAVRPRITELLDRGEVRETGSTRCPTTGKNVRRIDVHRAAQLDLFGAIQ